MNEWDVEVWHNTMMWNEGFEHAREPYTVVRVSSEATADLLQQWVRIYNDKPGTGEDKLFEARLNPSNPNRILPVLTPLQALGFIQGAISKWEGI